VNNNQPDNNSLLARIDERTENIQRRLVTIERQFDGYATREALLGVAARVDTMERNLTKAAWTGILSGLSRAAAIAGMLLKKL
jgi:hypothetical protein